MAVDSNEIRQEIYGRVSYPSRALTTSHALVSPIDDQKKLCVFCGREIPPKKIENDGWSFLCDCRHSVSTIESLKKLYHERDDIDTKIESYDVDARAAAIELYKKLYSHLTEARSAQFREIDEAVLNLTSED
jgi:hypothetical protein